MNLGLRGHIVTIYRHWGKILLVLLGAILVTGAIAFLSSKVYVAETRVLILTSSPASRATSTSVVESSRGEPPREQVLTQVEILKSPLLATKLAEELGPGHVIEQMTWKWDWLRELPQKWKEQAILALYNWDMTRDLIVSSGINIPTGEPGEPSARDAAEKIGDNLGVEAIVKTDMFAASFAAPDPEFSAVILNRLIGLYADHVVELSSPARTAAIAQAEADRLQTELREAERRLRQYAEENHILSIDKQKDLLLDRLSRLQDALADARRQNAEAARKIAALEERIDQLPSAEAVSVTNVANPLVDRLRERLSQLETEKLQYVPGSPSANKVQIEIEGIKSQLEKAQTAVRGSETVGTSGLYQQLQGMIAQEQADLRAEDVRVDFLSRELENVRSELNRLDQLTLRYRELSRMAESKEEAFRYALQKREETAIADQLSKGRNLAQVAQVEPAMPPSRPSAPRRFRLLALGVITGFFFGAGLAYLLEFSRRTMKTRQEAEIALGYPVLASQQMTGLMKWRRRANRTQIRGFASRLLHQLTPGRPLVLMFVSERRQTGQTTVIAAIADVLTSLGAPVLTIRTQLVGKESAPVQIAIRDKQNRQISDDNGAAAGHDDGPRRDTAILKAPAGKIHAAIRNLLRERGKMYQIVLIDCPDLGSFPEALYLEELTDLVLPVVEAGRSRVSDVLDLVDQFEDVGGGVPGIILTKLRHSYSSWAFCWMAKMRRESTNRVGEQQMEASA